MVPFIPFLIVAAVIGGAALAGKRSGGASAPSTGPTPYAGGPPGMAWDSQGRRVDCLPRTLDGSYTIRGHVPTCPEPAGPPPAPGGPALPATPPSGGGIPPGGGGSGSEAPTYGATSAAEPTPPDDPASAPTVSGYDVVTDVRGRGWKRMKLTPRGGWVARYGAAPVYDAQGRGIPAFYEWEGKGPPVGNPPAIPAARSGPAVGWSWGENGSPVVVGPGRVRGSSDEEHAQRMRAFPAVGASPAGKPCCSSCAAKKPCESLPPAVRAWIAGYQGFPSADVWKAARGAFEGGHRAASLALLRHYHLIPTQAPLSHHA